jgi:DNA (cytosine-5)-methyltransferase 1
MDIFTDACESPGGLLPQFPQPTHSKFPDLDGLKPYRMPCSVLRSILAACAKHQITGRQKRKNVSYKKWDPHQIAHCITCNGGGSASHPSGKRGLTKREVASLQGFPHWFVFLGYKLQRQIANAVPPSIAKILLRSVRRHLETVDGLAEAEDGEDEDTDNEQTEQDGSNHECVADIES